MKHGHVAHTKLFPELMQRHFEVRTDEVNFVARKRDRLVAKGQKDFSLQLFVFDCWSPYPPNFYKRNIEQYDGKSQR